MSILLAIPLYALGAFGLYVVFAVFADWGPWRRLFRASLKTLVLLAVLAVLYFIGDSIIGQLSWGWKVLYGLFLLTIAGLWLAVRRRMRR